MPLMQVGDQRRFLSFADEQARLAALEKIYQREAAWRLEQSHLALARRRAIQQRPRAPWQDGDRISAAASVVATSLEQRANAMRRKLRMTPARKIRSALTSPAAPAARRRAALRQPHTSYSLYAGQHVVEVLTKCRVQNLSRSDIRFVDARRY